MLSNIIFALEVLLYFMLQFCIFDSITFWRENGLTQTNVISFWYIATRKSSHGLVRHKFVKSENIGMFGAWEKFYQSRLDQLCVYKHTDRHTYICFNIQ